MACSFLASSFSVVAVAYKNMPSRNNERILMLRKMIMANRRRRKMLENGIALMLTNYQVAVKGILLTARKLISGHNMTNDRHHSCRR